MIHCFFAKILEILEIKKNPTMENLVVMGLQQLQTLFDTYEQFVGHLCNGFEICNVRSSLWNDTQGFCPFIH